MSARDPGWRRGPPTGTVDCCLSTRVRLLAPVVPPDGRAVVARPTNGGVMDVLHDRCAGLDIGKKDLKACVRTHALRSFLPMSNPAHRSCKTSITPPFVGRATTARPSGGTTGAKSLTLVLKPSCSSNNRQFLSVVAEQ